ncbi:DNA (cytosine-5-)-methyltransferase, partial [Listeria monocytogenes]|nr:DNA (cytosine-5-)-methyltransferase [Listeria monocytogenes]
MKKELTILELFAGVGGFRIGLETANKNYYKTLWSNQWEPSRKAQDAFNCYDNHFPESENLNEDISTISDERFANINADMIVGGFPCQDYSVARSLSGGMGIQGKKGVLFWEIIRATKIIQPTFLLLENVDRLLKSPASQRGRDFAIMLAAFNDLGYSVEWRVINAAEYGLAQKRRRVFIFVYKNKSDFAKKVQNYSDEEIIYNDGLFARGFPIENKPYKNRFVSDIISEDIVSVSDNFSSSIFNAGIMRNGKFTSIETVP